MVTANPWGGKDEEDDGGGIPEVDVAGAAAAYAAGGACFVDVREPEEWATARMPGSVHIPLGELAARLGELDRARPVVAVCRSGQRSLYATALLLDAGFAQTASLAGGLIAWAEAGQPLER
jgi:rhodanese-related sulfurtransferase